MSSVPVRVALTGGIATGKSRCLARFAALGAPVLDADELARKAVEPGAPGLTAVAERFGPAVFHPDGTLDRRALARLVFDDTDARRALEEIVHPLVYADVARWYEQLSAWSGARVAIADIPLLYETGHAGDFDAVIVTACRPEQQVERLAARGMTANDAAARIAAQWPTERKSALADYVIDTSGALEDTDRQVEEVWKKLAG